MSDFTQFENLQPIVIPPVEEKIYNKYWLRLLTIDAKTALGARLYAEFQPCRDIGEGLKELKPEIDGDIKVVNIPNIFEIAMQDNDFAMAMELVFRALKKWGDNNGVFGTPTPEPLPEPPVEPLPE